MSLPAVDVADLAADRTRRDWCILDVREAWERDIAAIEGSQHIPLGQLPARVSEIPDDRPVAVLCHSGVRSAQAVAFLIQSGHSNVYNVTGGIDRWSTEVDPDIARY